MMKVNGAIWDLVRFNNVLRTFIGADGAWLQTVNKRHQRGDLGTHRA